LRRRKKVNWDAVERDVKEEEKAETPDGDAVSSGLPGLAAPPLCPSAAWAAHLRGLTLPPPAWNLRRA
jgi:hypothetical protein